MMCNPSPTSTPRLVSSALQKAALCMAHIHGLKPLRLILPVFVAHAVILLSSLDKTRRDIHCRSPSPCDAQSPPEPAPGTGEQARKVWMICDPSPFSRGSLASMREEVHLLPARHHFECADFVLPVSPTHRLYSFCRKLTPPQSCRLPTPHRGHSKSSSTSLQGVPGAMPPSG